MRCKSPFKLLGETQSEGGTLRLSSQELVLLEFALDQFGEPLGRFLLSGLGENKVAPGWLFTITFTGGQSALYSRMVRVESDYRPDMITSVPRNKEPLVVLALLRLLIVNCNLASSKLHYDQEDVLELLEWEDTHEARFAIDEAVRRYSSLYYEWALGEQELAEANLLFFHDASRFILGYRYETIEDAGEVKRTANYVPFHMEFVEDLIRRSLFGISWNNVTSLERITC